MRTNGKKEKNSNWRGNKATYSGYHAYIRKNFGTPQCCEICNKTGDGMYHWAAVNHNKGGRERSDWLRLCVPCHSLYDGRTGKLISDEHKKR